MSAVAPVPGPGSSRTPRLYYGWIVLLVAAAAMVGTLPGRTQGLGLITEPLLADLRITRVRYAELNFWATILGSAGAIGVGQLIDRLGSRIVLTLVTLALSFVVCAMSQTSSFAALALWITLTRGLGQSALSVVSIALVGHWFVRKIDTAMAVYSVVMSIGFMIAFPLVGILVQQWGWRAAWLAVGCGLLGILDICRRHGAVRTRRIRSRTLQRVDSRAKRFQRADLLPDAGRHGVDGACWQFPGRMAGNPRSAWTTHGDLVIRPDGRSRRPAVSLHTNTRDDLGDRHGSRRGARDGPVLQRLATRLRTPSSGQNTRRCASTHGSRVGVGPAAPCLVRRVDWELCDDVSSVRRRHRVCCVPCADHARSVSRTAGITMTES